VLVPCVELQLQSQLSGSVVVSPLTGVVASRVVEPGELVAVGSPAFVVIDVSSVTAEASVDEGIVRKIRPGERVAEITAGTSEGTQVITEGQSFLDKGERVTIAK